MLININSLISGIYRLNSSIVVFIDKDSCLGNHSCSNVVSVCLKHIKHQRIR